MFERRWIWFGDLVSDEGFAVKYGNRTVTYTDERGSFEFGLEDGLLFPNPRQVAAKPVLIEQHNLMQSSTELPEEYAPKAVKLRSIQNRRVAGGGNSGEV